MDYVQANLNILMDHESEYNVIGSLLGLGPDILLELMFEMKLPQDIQQILVLNKKTYKLKEHQRFLIISEGIVRIEIVFQNTKGSGQIVGIADASCSFSAGKGPSWDFDNSGNTVGYYDDGALFHINIVKGNQSYQNGQRISAIVDMTSNRRKVVFYIDDIEQPNYMIGIPSEIRFWAYTWNKSSSFTVTRFERLVQFNSQIVPGSKAINWGKE
ncbi:MAG: hypothetical protein EZS28_027470 [Streblomastix strix]|uniref:B30.2/SPRY domain-containing protein n=1 Tax=Streblomastix strix TaxID=222440 RepID=A0A5J4V3E3_9EUKA|nr:MAG: hypothetical protein EZS28_027470 [Streblomastix strix]